MFFKLLIDHYMTWDLFSLLIGSYKWTPVVLNLKFVDLLLVDKKGFDAS